MKVYISVDMEGVAGVSHPDPDGPRRQPLPGCRRRSWSARRTPRSGARSTAARPRSSSTTATARCSTSGRPSSTAGRGSSRARRHGRWSRARVPTAGFGVALFVGYHARAGHPTGTIAHTYSGAADATRLNGRLVGETGINAAVLGAWGVPVGLVTGDDALAEEVAEWLPWAERVVVKDAVGGGSAASLHPADAAELIAESAKRPCGGRRWSATAGCGRSRSSDRW